MKDFHIRWLSVPNFCQNRQKIPARRQFPRSKLSSLLGRNRQAHYYKLERNQFWVQRTVTLLKIEVLCLNFHLLKLNSVVYLQVTFEYNRLEKLTRVV